MARKTGKKPCDRNEMESHVKEYLSIKREMFDTYRDITTDRYFSRKTGKRANARKAYSRAGRFIKVGAWIQENSPAEAAISAAFSDYSPALSLGEVPDAVNFLTSIAMGERPYQLPVPSDQEIIENRDRIADEMKGLVDIYKKIERGEEFQFPVDWYKKYDFLYRNTKPNRKNKLSERISVNSGMRYVLLAYQEGEPVSRLGLWLAMTPREVFSTDEGRAERDRLQKLLPPSRLETRWEEINAALSMSRKHSGEK